MNSINDFNKYIDKKNLEYNKITNENVTRIQQQNIIGDIVKNIDVEKYIQSYIEIDDNLKTISKRIDCIVGKHYSNGIFNIIIHNGCLFNLKNKYVFNFNSNSIPNHYYTCNNLTINQIEINDENELNKFLKRNINYKSYSPFEIFNSNISCGIQLINGLNNTYDVLFSNGYFENIIVIDNTIMSIKIKEELFQDFYYRLLIKNLKENHEGSLIIFSTNVSNNNNFEKIESKFKQYFEECLVNEITTYNSNSENDIVTYTLSLEKIKEIYE